MAVVSTSSRAVEPLMSTKWKERETSPEHTKIWTEPPAGKHKTEKKVPVVYYLSRNGQLEQPHFMEVLLSSPEGLHLRDVIDRLNVLRGKGIAGMYSWSAKRSYKNGFVWHDLAGNDFIYPAHGQEYVLKGSEVLDGRLISKSDESWSSSSKKPLPESRKCGDDFDFPVVTRRRNQSWSSIDLHEYKVYKAGTARESSGRAAADASTQTEDKRRLRRAIPEVEEEKEREENSKEEEAYNRNQNQSTELSRDEISPPPSDSSPETLETFMKADGRPVLRKGGIDDDPTVHNPPSGRVKASSVLMQLISCGAVSFKNCGPGYGKEQQGFSLVSHYKARLPRGGSSNLLGKDAEAAPVEIPSFKGRIKLEDKEYFSGSLVETMKVEYPALKRSNSYNADRGLRLELTQKEMEGGTVKCIPRKPKTHQFTRKESRNDHSTISSVSNITCNGKK